MAFNIYIPNPSRKTMGGIITNKTTQRDWVAKLWTNNYTPVIGNPSGGSVAGDFTEAAGGGYASITLTGASWTAGDDGVDDGLLTYADLVWTFTGALTSNATIYGCFFVQATSGLLMLAAKDTNPYTPTANGDTYRVPPSVRYGDLVA